jgi:hypothetical protein
MRSWDAVEKQELTLSLSSGRKVELTRLRVTLTFESYHLGSPEECSTSERRRLQEDPWSGVGIRIIDTHGPVLLPCKWIADFRSDKAVRGGNYSWLRICWFAADFERPLPDLLAAVLSAINWEDAAADGFFDDDDP